MDCPDLQFHSQVADWNVVSYATQYASVVSEPEKVVTFDGTGIPDDMRGALFVKITGNTRDLLSPADLDLVSGLHKGQRFAVLIDPTTGEAERDASGKLILLDAPRKTQKPEGFDRMVSWRTPAGVMLAHGGGSAQMLDTLQQSFPEVNVIRLDFNAATVTHERLADQWARFADAAAARGYRLIIQNSDGELAGGFVEGGGSGKEFVSQAELGPVDALKDPDGDWKINHVREDWQTMLQWFREPRNARILSAVAGWELINEPMAYGKEPQQAAIYSQHIADLIESLDWGDKRLLVGGMRASAQFADLDHDLIRQAAGDRLIWSAHMYPTWVTPGYPQSSGEIFAKQICSRIGNLDQPGDDIIVTESQLYTMSGSLDPATRGKRAGASFNLARKLPWLADQGIGWTWWPPTSRNSDLLQWQGARKGWKIELESAAFAHWGWIRDETSTQGEGEHWGSNAADDIGIDPQGALDKDHLVDEVNNPHGLIYGFAGDDLLRGHQGVDMLYGGAGSDQLQGGSGDDWLFGDRGDDMLEGSDGNDVLIDPEGRNHLTGGAGDDHLEGSGTLEGGAGADVLIASYGGDDLLVGGDGSDRFLPDTSGQVRIRDFTRGEDKLDLSMISGGRTCKGTIQFSASGAGSEITWPGANVVLPESGQLTQDDVIRSGPCRVVFLD